MRKWVSPETRLFKNDISEIQGRRIMKPATKTALFGLGSSLCVTIALIVPWIFMESELMHEGTILVNFLQIIFAVLFIPVILWYSYRAYLEKRQKVAHYGLFSPCKIIPSYTTKETPRYHFGLLLVFPFLFIFLAYVFLQNFAISSSITLVDISVLLLWGLAAVCIILGMIVYKESPKQPFSDDSRILTKYCPKCGRRGFKNLQFCSNCGTKLVQEPPQQYNNSVIKDK